MSLRVMVMAIAVLAAGCNETVVCPSGQTACGGHCVELSLDPVNCGTCGRSCDAGEACKSGTCTDCAAACGDGQTCQNGVCQAALFVACFATDEVVGTTMDLSVAGPSRPVDDGPISLAHLGDDVWVAHGLDEPVLLGFVPGVAGNASYTLANGASYYLNAVAASGSVLYVATEWGTLVVVDPSTGVKDEIVLGAGGAVVDPLGVALAGTVAVVPLYGSAFAPSFTQGQSIALVDVSRSPTCASPPCGFVLRNVALDVPAGPGQVGAYDAGGFPFPSKAAVVGTKAYVTLANLTQECVSGSCYYAKPAGDGRLAVLDTTTSADPGFVDLGPSCTNPGPLAADGTTLWISCSSSGTLMPIDVSGSKPVVGTPVPLAITPGGIAVCGGHLYVGDEYSGQVVELSNSGSVTTTATVCPAGPGGYAYAADVLCALTTP